MTAGPITDDEAAEWPFDMDAERRLVAALIQDLGAFDLAVQAGWRPGDFYRPLHDQLATAAVDLHERHHRRPDPVTLRDLLGRDAFTGPLGPAYVNDLCGLVVDWQNAGAFARVVHEKAGQRRLIMLSARLRARAYEGAPLAETLGWAEMQMAEIAALGGGSAAGELLTWHDLAANQAAAHRWLIPQMLAEQDKLILVGIEGSGKALALDTPIATPKGWTTMGQLAPGDQVFGPDGQPALVVAATPPMLGRPCYRVRFSDETEIVADAGHQWQTESALARDKRRGPGLVTTEGIAATLLARGGHQLNHAIATCAPLGYPAQDLPVPPYVLGAWLGDGTATSAEITCGDPEILDAIRAEGFTLRRVKSKPLAWLIQRPAPRRACLLAADGRCARRGRISRNLCRNHYERERAAGRLNRWLLQGRQPSLRGDLRLLGVLRAKHIPAAYLHASPAQRLALLQGLMDADGWVSGAGRRRGRGGGSSPCEFSVTSEPLARGVHELLLGLGIKVTWREAPAVINGRRVGTRYRLQFHTSLPVFRLPRKAARLVPPGTRRGSLRYIEACDPVPSVPVRCIRVDRQDGMFVAGEQCIPTHNSLIGAQVALCLGAGVHPLNPALRISPARTLVVDLELSAGMLARRARSLVPLADEAGIDRDMAKVWHRPAGLDLRSAEGQAELTAVIRRHQPKLVVAGPMYKMGCAEAENPGDFKRIADYLDGVVRERLGCAMWLEQHAPMRQGRGARELRPIGSVLWQQWPDFGWALRPSRDKTLANWYDWAYYRLPREERQWPECVYWKPQHQAGWPWRAQWPEHAWEDPLA